MLQVVYFSSVSGNTKRFVEKLEFPAQKIPLYAHEDELVVTDPYVLIVPTYGQSDNKAVPKQVIRFLNNKQNRDLITGVVSCGNTNFGREYCLAGDIISKKTDVPVLHRVELFGTPEDVEITKKKILELGETIESY